MASFEDRVQRVIEPQLRDIRELFLDSEQSESETLDLEPVMRKCDDILQWVKNVKSEVRYIEKKIPEQKKEEKREETPEERQKRIQNEEDEWYKRKVKEIGQKILKKLGIDWSYDLYELFYVALQDLLFNDADGSVLIPGPETPPALPEPQPAPAVIEKDVEDIRAALEYLRRCCHGLQDMVAALNVGGGTPPQVLITELRRRGIAATFRFS